MINLNDYRYIKIIGKGAYGNVHLIENIETGLQYAAKEGISYENDSLMIELQTYLKVDNSAILPFLGYSPCNFNGEKHPMLIIKYMENGSLKEMLKNVRISLAPLKYTNSSRYIMLLGIALGMKYLHSKGIIHRDLKPDNILLDDNLYPHICDFGCSAVSDKDYKRIILHDEIGTPLYMAPEIFDDENTYTYKVDVYAFSYVAYEIITDTIPFNNEYKNQFAFIEAIRGGKRPDLSLIKDKRIQQFLQKCWSSDPADRPSFLEIVNEIMKEPFRDYFNIVNEEEIDDYLDLFDDELKSPNSKDVLDIKKAADEGDIDAMILYSRKLYYGHGAEMNKKESARYIKMAADLNDEDAINCYALRALVGDKDMEKNSEEGLHYLKLGVSKGNPTAMFNYGKYLYFGNGSEPNKKEAAKYFKQAADMGNSLASNEYGFMLFNGDGIEVNKAEGIKYLKKAADLGDFVSMVIYGRILRDGDGIKADKEEAAKYLKKAADLGYTYGMIDYGIMIRDGDGVKANKKEAAEYFKKAADLGIKEPMLYYGIMLRDGDGIDANKAEAIKYIKKSIDCGHLNAIHEFGMMLLKGNQIKQDKRKAAEYLKSAADQGHSYAMLEYGKMLHDGNGINKDFKESIKYIRMSCNKGNPKSINYYFDLIDNKEIPFDVDEMMRYTELSRERVFNPNSGLSFPGFYSEKPVSDMNYQRDLAEKGNADAMYLCGMDLIGKTEEETAKGIEYIRRAANMGNIEAMESYGYMLYSGFNIKEDKREAARYFKMSIDQRNKSIKPFVPTKTNYFGDMNNMDIPFIYAKMLIEGNGIMTNVKEGAKYFKISADYGNPTSMFEYAKMLYSGEEIPKNVKEAAKYFKMSADLGNDLAMLKYGKILFEGKYIQTDEKEGRKYLKMAADQGNIDAMEIYGMSLLTDERIFNKEEAAYYLKMGIDKRNLTKEDIKSEDDKKCLKIIGYYADMLINGEGVSKNTKEGIKYLKKIADLGDLDSILKYAKILFFGDGIPPNKQESAKYYLKAANLGNEEAIGQYGYMLYSGEGVEMNKKEAAKYYVKAANMGNYMAMYSYARMLRHGDGIQQNMNESIRFYKMSAERGYDKAMLNLGHIYFQGENGVKKNMKEAAKYYKMAIDHGNVIATMYYSQMLINGLGVPVNKKEGAKYMKIAADAGYAKPMFFYGVLLLNGDGVPVDKKEGIRYIKMAVDNKDPQAIELYSSLFPNEKNNLNANSYNSIFKNPENAQQYFAYGKSILSGNTTRRQDGINYIMKAIEGGCADAMAFYSGLLIQEKGFNEEAVQYLRFAAHNGNQTAKKIFAIYRFYIQNKS